MSANLLAEFDSFYAPKTGWDSGYNENNGTAQNEQTRPVGEGGMDDRSSYAVPFQEDSFNPWKQESADQSPFRRVDDDADWGDFESGQSFEVDETQRNTWDGEDSSRPNQQYAAMGPTKMASTSNPFDVSNESTKASIRPPRDESVLFDIDDEYTEEDDFGDFESGGKATDSIRGNDQEVLVDFGTSMNPQQTALAQNNITKEPNSLAPPIADFFGDIEETVLPIRESDNINELPGTMDNINDARDSYSSPVSRNADVDWDFEADRSHMPLAKESGQQARVVEAGVSLDLQNQYKENFAGSGRDNEKAEDDTWDDFDDATSQHPKSRNLDDIKSELPEPTLPHLLPNLNGLKAANGPPTNIPPPALLLPLFPPIFAKAQDTLNSPTSTQGDISTVRNEVLATQDAKEFLLSYLDIVTVLAHIIAGRKFRWKRDTHLSQSMRMGPASAGGKSSGMKLAGIDKSESMREDREVADVIRAWRAQAGRLRSAISIAGITRPVPEVTETMPVRIAQASEGAVAATKQCALCALKRNERVAKVDFDVQDSFGEFWTDHWGHTMCMRFWYSYEQSLAGK